MARMRFHSANLGTADVPSKGVREIVGTIVDGKFAAYPLATRARRRLAAHECLEHWTADAGRLTPEASTSASQRFRLKTEWCVSWI